MTSPYPKISVVTPSFNQGQFLEETLCSVLDQGYPNLEYIVIDGGSTDSSVEIIQKYAPHLAYWVSEKDSGQSHAINKGFLKATGDILCWLNSDDRYLPGTLKLVAEHFSSHAGCFALMGHSSIAYIDGRPTQAVLGHYTNHRGLLQFWKGYHMHQPSIFWRREVYEKIGLLDEDLHYIMDFDYWTRISRQFGFQVLDQTLSCATYHADAKTGDGYERYYQDLRKYSRRYWGTPLSLEYWRMQVAMWHDMDYQPALARAKQSVKRRFTSDDRITRGRNTFNG